MKCTIETVVSNGIHSLGELHDALHLAMRLEFATIPPYLCAQWSITEDPDRVEGTLHKIVGQEMIHLALAGNTLSAIGGRPLLATPKFISVYPTSMLPGDVWLSFPLDLRPLDKRQLAVFMDIEKPEFPPVPLQDEVMPSIGAFYDTIITGLKAVNPDIDPKSEMISIPGSPVIGSIEDAIHAINRIKQEGEGTQTSPEQPKSERETVAHYYLFKELAVGRRLIFESGKWKFEGDPVSLPCVQAFFAEAVASPENLNFSRLVARLLLELEQGWTIGRPFDVATMFEMELAGRKLINKGITPQFTLPDQA
jgi:hypothetical protein